MKPEDAKKLLGGYATGTLTEAEQEALFAAALDDQELFDALGREQSLREVLQDPAVKAELLAALDERPRRWWNWRPAAVLGLAGLAALAVVVVVRQKPPAPAVVAEVRAPAAQAPAPEAVTAERPPAPAPPRRKAATRVTAPSLPEFARQPAGGGAVGGNPPTVATLAAPPAPPVSTLRPLDNSASIRTQSKAFTADATPSARDLFYALPAAATRFQTGAVADLAARGRMGLRYTVLRKQGAGFVEADPENLTAQDTVAIRFTANANGFLSLDGATPVAISAMQPYTTAAIDAAEIRVVFSRIPEVSAEGGVVTERRDRETYVVNTPPATAIAFTIALKRN